MKNKQKWCYAIYVHVCSSVYIYQLSQTLPLPLYLSISVYVLISGLSYQTASLLLDLIVLVIAKINISNNNYIQTYVLSL